MCGIAGVISADPRPVELAVGSMMQAMVHRGPDDSGYEQLPLGNEGRGPVAGFGFRRLAILDLSLAGHQPMFHPPTGNCLIFNGEIYNFRWLRAKLQSQGVRVRSSGDTEVLLHCLSTWGPAAIDQLDGMFAFAFYHAQSRRVLLARDPLGIKPLYVARTKRAFVFASEVRAVLASGLVPDDLDPAGIASFLAYGAPQDPLTVHRAIHSFPSGTYEWIGSDVASGQAACLRQRFWSFPRESAAQPEAQAVRAIQLQLRASVRDQCVCDVPLGVFLSGGIDSAALAAMARNHKTPVETFSVGFESSSGDDELVQAAATARLLATHHRQTILDDDWIMLQWREWLHAADRPSIDGLNTFVVSGVVKDVGATVALSGLGADELFGGYPSFHRVPRMHRLLSMLAWIPSSLRRAAARVLLASLPAGKREKAIDLVSGGTSALELAAHFRRLTSDSDMRLLGFDAKALGLSRQFLPPEAFGPLAGGDSFCAVSQVESCLYMANTLLRDTDTNSMAHSLEVRVPFLSRWLVDLVGGLPGSVRSPKGSSPKHLLRQAMADTLPPEIFNRPKKGFSLPVGDWMFGPLDQECEAAVGEVASCSLFDRSSVQRMWDTCRARKGVQHWSRPMALVALGSYLKESRHINQRLSVASGIE